MRKYLKKAAGTYAICFLPAFMLLIFGPAEIFFSNSAEFQFVYGEFAGYLALMAFAISAVAAVLLTFLPDKAYRVVMSVLFGMSFTGYLQVMFLNKRLDLLGVDPEAAKASIGRSIGNIAIWILIIAAVTALSMLKKELWMKMIVGASAFLIAIQTAALAALLLKAPKDAFKRQAVNWHLSGENQYTVSADKNVIVIILDYFGNEYIERVDWKWPGTSDFLHDFTSYRNADCVYFGTFPSLPHMLSGCDVDMTLSVNDWCEQIWNSEKTRSFYDMLDSKGYAANLYTPDLNMLCGANDKRLVSGIFSNMVNDAQEVEVSYKLLFKTMCKMSAYRMAPDAFKPKFYSTYGEYMDIVREKVNRINHNNHEFYKDLLEKGLKTDDSANYFIVQHLMGTHIYNTDVNGFYVEDGTLEETAKGCMTIVKEYLDQLMELGVYEDATIIITADHGDPFDAQVPFYIKQPGEHHDVSPVTQAPITHCEFLPTIAAAVGADASQYGQTIYDFYDGQLRERTYWFRAYDDRFEKVPMYTGERDSIKNVYYGMTYTGDTEALIMRYGTEPDKIVLMVDCFF